MMKRPYHVPKALKVSLRPREAVLQICKHCGPIDVFGPYQSHCGMISGPACKEAGS